MKKIAYVGLFLCSIYLASSCNYNKKENEQGQKTSEEKTNEQAKVSADELKKKEEAANFVTQAANNNLAEIHLGKVAAEKGTSSEVKKFAKDLVDMQTKANEELKLIADKNNIAFPATLTDKDQEMVNELSKETGYEFDEKFMNKMVESHKEAVDMYEKASKEIENSEIKNYASNTLPAIKSKLEMARQDEELVQNRKVQIRKKEKNM